MSAWPPKYPPGQNPWPLVLIAVATTVVGIVLDRLLPKNNSDQ